MTLTTRERHTLQMMASLAIEYERSRVAAQAGAPTDDSRKMVRDCQRQIRLFERLLGKLLAGTP